MAQRRRSGQSRSFELWGLLRPLKTEEGKAAPEDEDAESNDDEDGDPDPEDFEDVFGGANQEPLHTPARKTLIIQEEDSQKTYEVIGRFPLVDPWWKVNAKLTRSQSKYYMKSYPSYFLQHDAGRDIISLFFRECAVPQLFQDAFFEWFPKESLNFAHLEKTLKQFQESKLQEGVISTNTQSQTCTDTKNFDIFHYVKESFAGKAVLVALAFPNILELMPLLLPRAVSCCIAKLDWSKIHAEDYTLRKLHRILKEKPWKLGFGEIIKRELHTYFGEASWKAICECRHILEKIPDLQKNALMVYEKLKQSCAENGNTYEEQHELTRMVSKNMPVEHAWESIKFMKDENIVVTERELVFLPHLFNSEKQIATSVCELSNKTPWQLRADPKKVLNRNVHATNMRDVFAKSEINDEELCAVDQKEPGNSSDVQENSNHDSDFEEPEKELKHKVEVDPDQESAIELICSNPVTIVSGKGGCGKTTIVTHLFCYLREAENTEAMNACKDFEADLDASEEWNTFGHASNMIQCRNESLNVLYTAPTGRAASLLSDKTGQPAYTLHQVTYSFSKWSENKCNPWKFSSVNVLVVDEGSMVPVRMLSRVLRLLLDHARLAKIIILGDVRQLPSIEPGNMLADIFESLQSRGWSIELKTNHRAESQLIVDNATRISQQKYPKFDEVLRMSEENKTWAVPSAEKKFIFVVLPPGDDGHYLQCAIEALLKNGPGLQDPKQSQFIAFRRKDCDIINEICCRHYSGHTTRNHKNRLQFLRGDKICSSRNAYMKDLLAGSSDPCTSKDCSRREARLSGRDADDDRNNNYDDRRLCNGEIFFIKEDKEVNGRRFLTIGITDGPEYVMHYRALQKHSKIKHAWARTIHTFQGSEENTIVYVVGDTPRQNWQHVYTAITRGRCRVYIIAEEAKLQAVIAKKSFRRKTRLKAFMKDATAEEAGGSEQTSPQKSWQSQQENDTCDVASHSGNSRGEPAVPAVSLKMEVDDAVVEPAGTAEETSGGLKRQQTFPDDCSSPSKVCLVTENTSPLGTTKLQSLTLKSPHAKQLFPS
ncbi:DNA helicase B isoform X1 [Zootoca vivipara]|uniref:DNA helicase B isoform X1 n=1 Tax=Zootoca vivipara TaxID=8524 RepID=UPI00293BB188|nr:DNA helicase B isoform X1 [Zootoca vivipara]XP_060135625.1 DNA helicase B isoform X1 [Zootoca vivipara]